MRADASPGVHLWRRPPVQSGLVGSSFQLSSASLATFGPGRSSFGAGSGFAGSPSASTRRQNGVKTRKPRPSLLRIAEGGTSRSPGKLSRVHAELCQRRFELFLRPPDAGPERSHSSRRHPRRCCAPSPGSPLPPPPCEASAILRSCRGRRRAPAATAPATSAPRRPAPVRQPRQRRRGRSPARRFLRRRGGRDGRTGGGHPGTRRQWARLA